MKNLSLYGHLVSQQDSNPQHRAFVDLSGPTPETWTLTDLRQESERVASFFQTRELTEGDCVAVWLPTWPLCYAFQFGASAVGAHVIGVNTRYNVLEVAHVLAKSKPRIIAIAHDFRSIDFLQTLKDALTKVYNSDPNFIPPHLLVVPAPRATIALDPADYDVGGGATSWDTVRYVELRNPRFNSSPNTLSVAFTTSGSTGMPKLAAHKELAVLHHLRNVSQQIPLSPEDIMVEPLPYSGVFGYVAGMAAVYAGAAVMLQDAFDPKQLALAWNQYHGSHFVGADDMISRVRVACEQFDINLHSWRWAGMADFQGMSRELAKWAFSRFQTQTVGVYGSSEVFALTSFWPVNAPDSLRLSGGGKVVASDYKTRVVDPVTNTRVSLNEAGEIQLRGPNVVDTYLGDSGEHKSAFTSDGWFKTGDLGRQISSDSFSFVCRMGDVLRLKGFMVDPAEIETHISTHPGVEIVKVVGRKGSTGEDEAVAFVTVEKDHSLSEHELINYCTKNLARYKVPTEIRLVDEMPSTVGTNGSKIKTVTLREWAQQKRTN